MVKSKLLIASLFSVTLLSGCDNNDLTPEQKLQLRQLEMQQQHELDMARATHPAPVVQNPPQVIYQNESYPSSNHISDVRSNSGSAGSGIGSHVASAAVGAAAGYYAGKHLSKSENVSKARRKAYTGYRYTKSKVSSKYRKWKK